MPYPSITAYAEAILISDNFKELVGIKPVMAANGRPHLIAGGFAVVFKMKFAGKFVAVKCFLNEVEDRKTRYTAIAEYLDENPSPYFVPYHYYDQELFIDGEEYPVLVMDWIEGETLGGAVQKLLQTIDDFDSQTDFDIEWDLNTLTRDMVKLFMDLLDLPVAHGDLKYDNVMVTKSGYLKLIDYDGMYVPALFGQKATEMGSMGFQHPDRDPTWFDQHMDDFSILIMTFSQLLIIDQASEQEKMRINGQVFQLIDLKLEPNSILNQYRDLIGLQFISTAIRTLLHDKNLTLDITAVLNLTIQINSAFSVILEDINKTKSRDNKEIKKIISNEKTNDANIKAIRLFYEYYINKNYKKSLILAQELIQQNNSFGQFIFAEIHYYGKGIFRFFRESNELDNEEALKYYKLAAEQGNEIAQIQIGSCNYAGMGTKVDKVEAVKWVMQAAKQGNSQAQFSLGKSFYQGDGIEKNEEEAVKWIKIAAKQGNAMAQLNLGYCYERGIGVTIDKVEAVRWIRLSAEQNIVEAQYRLGTYLENGHGVPVDSALALKLYKLAAKQRFYEAIIKVRELEEKMV